MGEGSAPDLIPLEPGAVAIADLHLDPASALDCDGLVHWLDQLEETPRLLVLGDLFDAWVGPAHQGLEGSQAVIGALRRLSDRGAAVDLLHGNRDFLLDQRFAAACGALVRPEGVVGTLPSAERVVLVHGDTLCTRDHAYQRYRRISHSAAVRGLALSLPLFISSRIARRLRRVSIQAVAEKLPEEKALQTDAAIRLAAERDASTVVCGHAHEARDERVPEGPRWIVLDAFGGERDVLTVNCDGDLELTGSGAGRRGA